MSENYPPSRENETPEKRGLTRRGFLSGAMASLVTSQVAAEETWQPPTESLRPKERPENWLTGQESTEELKEYVYATRRPITEQIYDHTDTLHRDVDLVLERAHNLVADYEGYDSVFALVQAELPLSNIPEPVQSTVREYMTFVPIPESRLDAEAVSDQKAFGILQLMPATWDGHAKDGEEKDNLIDQVHVAGRLLEQTYRYLMQRHADTIDVITNIMFDGDADRCAREFLSLAVIAGYFAGMGSVANTLDGFLHDYVDLDEAQKMHKEGVDAEPYGVYSVFSRAGEVHQYDKNFGPETNNYFPKVLAAQMSVRVSVTAAQYEELLHGDRSA